MKVGFITSEYPHPQITHAAGIGTSIKNLAVALVNKGVGVTVFVYQQNENTIISDEGVEIHLIKKESFKYFTWYFYRKLIQLYVNKVVEDKKIDVLEAPDWTGITAFTTFKVPLVIRFHGSDAYFCKLEKRKQKFKNFVFEKKALIKAAAYIAPTTFAGKETQKIFSLNKKKIKTIHYGLQLKDFENETPLIYNRNTILYIGTIIRKKGVFELAEIFNKVIESNQEAQLILIGNDAPDIKTGASSTYKLVENLFSNEAKKKVNYLGKVPYSEVKNHIKNAHVCVFPSFAETLGMVAIESMALQKPVVNTNIGWAQELIDDGENGFLVHPSNIDLYAKHILTLMNDENLCAKIGKTARKKVETTFNIEILADQNIAYYKSILK
ncbi:glycosyltransferase involved in cell wall biosynthesis [Mariniflexile fucanivorans]|uniref:Glycosyltransferase involved in cell wall biosynthesis n=1 Tax=Mariniflexile fucanivorans TaxID=264023 RepID=A0A4R1REA7_9FLAO|nr:glycosyltransferase family 4 protein [Mariniflexile fucanivorans]TCL63892.1 glycosyltransferase involved in cell wall biosynthesis [Mariniflexile fucanivorans]